MKKFLSLLIVFCFFIKGFSQGTENNAKRLLEELSISSCDCIDKISVSNKDSKEVSSEINKCIEEQVNAYQLGSKLIKIDTTRLEKEIEILIDNNSESKGFKKYYYEMESYLFENCNALKNKIAVYEKMNSKSMSRNPKALKFYSKGVKEFDKQKFKKAVSLFKKALKVDKEFAFAWDNLGLSYRKLNKYDKAIESYEKSIEIDPYGLMPLQNIAIVYQYKKEFHKAIDTYKKLSKLDNKNPEVYYGIGQIYSLELKNYEKGLDYMCKAYVKYTEQKSPYRVDAEKVISIIYSEMKKNGNEDRFNEILKLNNISQ
jgi:tetratricopeptide (TPR) repeat protein